MTLTLLARLLITARSTLTSINSFGFIWKSLASLCPAHPSLFSSPRVRVVPRSLRKARDPRPLTPGLPPAGRSGKTSSSLVAKARASHAHSFPGRAFCSGATLRALPRTPSNVLSIPGLVFLNPAQNSNCALISVLRTTFSTCARLFSDMSHSVFPTLSANKETSEPPCPTALGRLPFFPDPISPSNLNREQL